MNVNWVHYNQAFTIDSGLTWVVQRLSRLFIVFMSKYALNILVPHYKPTSVFGFALLINMATQMISGILLSLYYIPDPTVVMTMREEYMNEIWWFAFVYKTHLVGVDSIFVLSYLHIWKKIFIKNFVGSELEGWVSGTYAFFIYHIVVFLGITLSNNHLGDLTLTIGASIFWSLFAFEHEAYSILFTNRHMNGEQLTRFMVAHYCIAWYYLYLVQSHVMYIHEMWNPDSAVSAPQDSNSPKANWFIDALQREGSMMLICYTFWMVSIIRRSHPDLLPVNFTFFEQWAEVENEDVNFFIVGPHWYFRPHMGLLTICAEHYEGLFWLVMYYVILGLMPLWARLSQPSFQWGSITVDSIPITSSISQITAFVLFIGSMAYICGTLPCARFYYESEEGFFGNTFLRLSYQYIYLYLLFIIHWLDRVERFVISNESLGGSKEKMKRIVKVVR